MKPWPLAMLCSAIGVASPTFANPVGPVVAAGTATINQSGNALTVTSSNGAIVNWNTFSIPAGSTTHFVQPAASSTVLNRVLNDPSAIYGRLSSNGRVWLVNPAGIMVGSRTNRININTLVAPRHSSPSSASNPAPTATSLPPRTTPAIAASANAGRMVDGSVTLRTSLVDTSPILFR